MCIAGMGPHAHGGQPKTILPPELPHTAAAHLPRCGQDPARSHISADSGLAERFPTREEVVLIVSKNVPELGAPLRNRTVDLLLAIET
jgi:hypothetical protein